MVHHTYVLCQGRLPTRPWYPGHVCSSRERCQATNRTVRSGVGRRHSMRSWTGRKHVRCRTVSHRDDAVLEGILFVLVPQRVFVLHGRRGVMPHRRCDRGAALSKPSRSLDELCASIVHPTNTDTHTHTYTLRLTYVRTYIRTKVANNKPSNVQEHQYA